MKEGKPEQPPYYENLRAKLKRETGNIVLLSGWISCTTQRFSFSFFTRHFLLGARKHAISLTATALREDGQMAMAHWSGLAGRTGYRHRKEWVALR